MAQCSCKPCNVYKRQISCSSVESSKNWWLHRNKVCPENVKRTKYWKKNCIENSLTWYGHCWIVRIGRIFVAWKVVDFRAMIVEPLRYSQQCISSNSDVGDKKKNDGKHANDYLTGYVSFDDVDFYCGNGFLHIYLPNQKNTYYEFPIDLLEHLIFIFSHIEHISLDIHIMKAAR